MNDVTRTSKEKVCDDKLQIVYEHRQPYGIRDRSGFLFTFRQVRKYDDQEERYRRELQQFTRLADFLLAALQSAHEPPADDPPSPEHLRLLNAALNFVPRDRQIHSEIVALLNRPRPPPSVGLTYEQLHDFMRYALAGCTADGIYCGEPLSDVYDRLVDGQPASGPTKEVKSTVPPYKPRREDFITCGVLDDAAYEAAIQRYRATAGGEV